MKGEPCLGEGLPLLIDPYETLILEGSDDLLFGFKFGSRILLLGVASV